MKISFFWGITSWKIDSSGLLYDDEVNKIHKSIKLMLFSKRAWTHLIPTIIYKLKLLSKYFYGPKWPNFSFRRQGFSISAHSSLYLIQYIFFFLVRVRRSAIEIEQRITSSRIIPKYIYKKKITILNSEFYGTGTKEY